MKKIKEAEQILVKAKNNNGFGPRMNKLWSWIEKSTLASWDRWLFFACLALELEQEVERLEKDWAKSHVKYLSALGDAESYKEQLNEALATIKKLENENAN